MKTTHSTLYHVKTPSPYAAGEISVRAAAERLAVSVNVVYYWIDTGQLHGVWGGTPQQELRRLITRDRRGRAQARRASVHHRNAVKDRCEHGHPFNAANTYYTPTGERRCRICRRAVDRARERRRRPGRVRRPGRPAAAPGRAGPRSRRGAAPAPPARHRSDRVARPWCQPLPIRRRTVIIPIA